ncbi:MAG: type II toxin-antitoxin system RelB/DinJ family antitoxin [Defluviitaleaceae bacterium]|nr:type II toxin-antitoxin system RelB/DinJ family antitoxin [Defluviitaleaceae bacterium]MCL2835639.1 type II toxin-antitoxin system RelB/DinJ family antitoxin [Defluviitaleaceae bacterium]
MASVNVTIRLDEETKKQFDIFCDNTGMNITTAINMFIKATLRSRELPFVVTDKNSYEIDTRRVLPHGRN